MYLNLSQQLGSPEGLSPSGGSLGVSPQTGRFRRLKRLLNNLKTWELTKTVRIAK
jgi:hypothetical protein